MLSPLRRAALALALLLALGLALAPSAALAQTANAVTISDFQFTPASLTVPVGTKVTWTNNGPSNHTVTANQGAFDSGALAKGQSFSFTFASAGTFAYHCSIHPFMTGSITVSGAAAAPASSSAAAAPSPAASPAASAAPASASPAASAAPASASPSPAPTRAPSASAAGASAKPAPSALPKTGAGGGAPSAPVWLWLAPAAGICLGAGWAVRRRLHSRT